MMPNRKSGQYVLTAITLAAAGWVSIYPARAAARINVNNRDAAGEGFNDPTPFVSVGGNPATTLGAARLLAIKHAATIWGRVINSPVTIQIDATMDPLTCGPGAPVLAQVGPTTGHMNFLHAPLPDTVYTQAEANSLAGFDLDFATADITAQFNVSIDDAACVGATSWYYGLDGQPPLGDYDFVTVALRELAHGLGFMTFVDLPTGKKFGSTAANPEGGFNDVYMLNLERHGAVTPDYPSMTNLERFQASTSSQLHWVGPNVIEAARTKLTIGLGSGFCDDGVTVCSNDVTCGGAPCHRHVLMFAPPVQKPGYSVNVFSNALHPDELMEPYPQTGVANHEPGLALDLLKDIGWSLSPRIGTDIVFIMDVTGSTGALLPNWVAQIPTIAQSWKAYDPNARFAVVSHADFPFSPYGNATCRPAPIGGDYGYRVQSLLDPSIANLQAALANLNQMCGVDDPESQYEALYQVLTGEGRDLSGVVNYTDAGEYAPVSLWPAPDFARYPMAIYMFTWPEQFHDRDVEPNYPFAGAKPVAGKSATETKLAELSNSTMFFGLTFVTGLEQAGRKPNDPPQQIFKHPGALMLETTGPLGALSSLTRGAVYNVGTDLSQLPAAITASITLWSGSTQSTGETDGDGVPDSTDNCAGTYNPDQLDSDGDGVGNACDNCPTIASADQSDSDLDGRGDVCDNCRDIQNPTQTDTDADSYGNACDCAPDNSALFVLPEEAPNVAAASKSVVTWNPAPYASLHDVVRGRLSSLPVGPGGADEVCFLNLPAFSLSDATNPAPGNGYWYVVRGTNGCGSGTFGKQGKRGIPSTQRVTACP